MDRDCTRRVDRPGFAGRPGTVSHRLEKWKQDDFIRAFRTGVLPNGKQLGPTMSSKTFREMTDMELSALCLYFMDSKP